MEKRERFYADDSIIYGFTVYDRNSQTPAFKYGAECNMKKCFAYILAKTLNLKDKKGLLED